MSRSWATLPVEILSNIFSIIEDLETEIQCQYVCKGWLLPAQAQRFQQVKIRWNKLVSHVHAMLESPHEVGKYIRTLEIKGQSSYGSTSFEIFPQFSRTCPNIKIFKYNGMPDDLWPQLLKVVQSGYWPKIQILPPPESIFNLVCYTKTVLKCPKLESLTLLLWENQSEENQGCIEKLAKSLNSFKFLKELYIETFGAYLDISVLESMVKIEDCPSLKSIHLNPEYSSVIVNPTSETIDLTRVKPAPNILSFKGYLVMSENSFKYLSVKFSKLNNLSLVLDTKHFFSLQQNQGVDTNREIAIDQFFKYVSKIENAKLLFIHISNLSNLIARYFGSSNCCHKKMILTLNSLPAQTQTTSSMLLKTCSKTDSILWGEEIDVTEISVDPEKSLSDLEVIEFIGRDIEVLQISALTHEMGKEYELAVKTNMKEAIRFCNSLKTLILTNIPLSNTGNIPNQSLEKVVMDINLKKQQETVIDANNLPSLKYISVFSKTKIDKRIQLCYYFNIKLPSNNIKNISWNFSKSEYDTAYEVNFSYIYLWISYSNGKEESYLYDFSVLRKATESDFLYFQLSNDYNDSNDRCCIRVFCKSLRSVTFNSQTSSAYIPTTFLLNENIE